MMNERKDVWDEITDAEIDAGAEALREWQMSGRITVPWLKVPNPQKKKWHFAAAKVLEAARLVKS